MKIQRTPPAGATSNPDAADLRERQPAGDESHVHLSSDFDLDEAFISEADAGPAPDTSEPVREATRAQARPFPVRLEPTPSELELLGDPSGSFSIAELLETSVPLDWREAVSIARRMCEAIGRHPAAGTHEYHLDPRHIEITEQGDVVVEPGEPGTDPFVKQVGRILRALLEGGAAPAPLRLLVSQAVFDVPGFISLEEFSQALSRFEREAEGDAVRTAFRRAREKKYSAAPVTSAPSPPGPFPPSRAGKSSDAEPSDVVVGRPPRPIPHGRAMAAAAAILLGAAAALVPGFNRSSVEVPAPPPQAAVAPTTAAVTPQAAPSAPLVEATPTPPAAESPPAAPPRARVSDLQRRPTSAVGGITPRPTSETAAVTPPPQPAVAPPPRPTPPSSSALEEPGTRPPSAIVPDAVQDPSLRTLALAFDQYNRARAALDQENYEEALSDAGRAVALLDTLAVGVAPGELRDRLNQLVARADAVRAREEARVYTVADGDVTPPVAVGRQLPSAMPAALAHTKIGTLEMVINRDGHVETLKLRTPLNRFHERMIVSAAKAWRYRPALKNGRPVRFLLVSSINLPES